MNQYTKAIVALLALAVIVLPNAEAHCDTMDGPVITAARTALETGNVNYVLIWVQPNDEATIRKAFEKALNAKDKEKAEMDFFETLVRVHREGEGAPYTGIKPEGTPVEPIIPIAEQAIEDNNAQVLSAPLNHALQEGIEERLAHVQATKNYDTNDVEAGREYIEQYVGFLHYAEGVDAAVHASSEHNAEHEELAGRSSGVGWAAAGVIGGASAAVLAVRYKKK